MRRPLDWILSISLVVLVANHVLRTSDPVGRVPVPAAVGATVAQAGEHSPFAWIREDGSLDYLPSTGQAIERRTAGVGATTEEAESGTRPALTESVFTWTLPMVTPATEIRYFQ